MARFCGLFLSGRRFSTAHHAKGEFASLGLQPRLCDALAKLNLTSPTPIQKLGIPSILQGKNTLLASQTGTGKTLAYLLPLLDKLKAEEESGLVRRPNRPRILIVLPARELGEQVLEVCKTISHEVKFSAVGIFGRDKQKLQKSALEKAVDVVVCTPGRLNLLRTQGELFLSDVRSIVIDEADSLLDESFDSEVTKLLLLGKSRVNRKDPTPLLYVASSATVRPAVMERLKSTVGEFTAVQAPRLHSVPEAVKQVFHRVKSADKFPDLLKVLGTQRTIVFCNGADSARAVEHFLRERGYPTTSLHGEIPPLLRKECFDKFLSGEAQVLVATDAASRGLDTLDVTHVVSFDFPNSAVDYIHRAGRTGRMGRTGQVTSLVARRDYLLAQEIERQVRAEEGGIDVRNTRQNTKVNRAELGQQAIERRENSRIRRERGILDRLNNLKSMVSR